VFTVSSTLIWAVLTGQTDWVCHIGNWDANAMCRGSCLELNYCNLWSGSGEIQAWSRWLTGLIVPEMTYNVLSGTLSNQLTAATKVVYFIHHSALFSKVLVKIFINRMDMTLGSLRRVSKQLGYWTKMQHSVSHRRHFTGYRTSTFCCHSCGTTTLVVPHLWQLVKSGGTVPPLQKVGYAYHSRLLITALPRFSSLICGRRKG